MWYVWYLCVLCVCVYVRVIYNVPRVFMPSMYALYACMHGVWYAQYVCVRAHTSVRVVCVCVWCVT